MSNQRNLVANISSSRTRSTQTKRRVRRVSKKRHSIITDSALMNAFRAADPLHVAMKSSRESRKIAVHEVDSKKATAFEPTPGYLEKISSWTSRDDAELQPVDCRVTIVYRDEHGAVVSTSSYHEVAQMAVQGPSIVLQPVNINEAHINVPEGFKRVTKVNTIEPVVPQKNDDGTYVVHASVEVMKLNTTKHSPDDTNDDDAFAPTIDEQVGVERDGGKLDVGESTDESEPITVEDANDEREIIVAIHLNVKGRLMPSQNSFSLPIREGMSIEDISYNIRETAVERGIITEASMVNIWQDGDSDNAFVMVLADTTPDTLPYSPEGPESRTSSNDGTNEIDETEGLSSSRSTTQSIMTLDSFSSQLLHALETAPDNPYLADYMLIDEDEMFTSSVELEADSVIGVDDDQPSRDEQEMLIDMSAVLTRQLSDALNSASEQTTFEARPIDSETFDVAHSWIGSSRHRRKFLNSQSFREIMVANDSEPLLVTGFAQTRRFAYSVQLSRILKHVVQTRARAERLFSIVEKKHRAVNVTVISLVLRSLPVSRSVTMVNAIILHEPKHDTRM